MRGIFGLTLLLLVSATLLVNSQGDKVIKPKEKAQPPTPIVSGDRSGEKRTVTVLYEALCPESERFMEQLGPVYEALKDYMQIEFVPYGLTKLACKRNLNGKCERPVFTCKHGPAGCKANRLHGCALQYSESPEKQINFIMCTMGPNHVPAEKCLHLLSFNQNEIDNCLIFDEGTELQMKAYERTEPFKPQRLPIVVFDNKYSDEIQDGALKDFRILACNLMAHKYQLIKEDTSPNICRTSEVFSTLS